ncbi:glucose-6-phosphate isomerase [Desulfuribacillus stibiiarsenatis]|uniref:Glucose-6-phosphate isomerase n=1 Tax=Desulfuribacillus stibiiarsenatis TaxID=1390249 RepID=A0A1E5L7L2_9FIRM|nr:glucose-6-phosphate isomerase [Desulfuribacillus stibiiarsenatis]OEH86116.1 glucose-6-phosphate isomerase [Desulfuribacillus stibiiarsenatis]
MKRVTFDWSNAKDYINLQEIQAYSEKVEKCHAELHEGTGQGNDFLGWLELPQKYNQEEFNRILKEAKRIQENSDILIVVGIGGSYLGARAVIESLQHTFYSLLPKEKRTAPQILYLGNNISSRYINDLLDVIIDRDVSVNVISKSGTTTEPAIAFRIIKDWLENKYGKEIAKSRIYATTDQQKGALKQLANEEGYETFVVPDDVGGRYSVLTAVGLLPIAVSGINIEELMQGAKDAYADLLAPNLMKNDAYLYAAIRNTLYNKGKTIEVFASYEPSLTYISEWWKQLFGESEGKDGKGIFPAAVNFTTDLHSMGQYVQDGLRNLFETVVYVETSNREIVIEAKEQDADELNYLAGKSLDFINYKALQGTMLAHTDGHVPNLTIMIPELSPYYIGYLLYFYQKTCAISGYLLGVNPFDQPGVEAYKKNMFALLGKPGYEDRKAELEKRLKG